MQIRIRSSKDKKIFAIGPPRGRKFGEIDAPQNFEVQPLYLRNASNDPQIFFHLTIKRPNIGQAAKL